MTNLAVSRWFSLASRPYQVEIYSKQTASNNFLLFANDNFGFKERSKTVREPFYRRIVYFDVRSEICLNWCGIIFRTLVSGTTVNCVWLMCVFYRLIRNKNTYRTMKPGRLLKPSGPTGWWEFERLLPESRAPCQMIKSKNSPARSWSATRK